MYVMQQFRDATIQDDFLSSLPHSLFLSQPPTQTALARPILYSNWLTKDYLPVNQGELREYVQARLKVFYEEELDVPLVLFDEVLDHVLRIDRIFKQSQVQSQLYILWGLHIFVLGVLVIVGTVFSLFTYNSHTRYLLSPPSPPLLSPPLRDICC